MTRTRQARRSVSDICVEGPTILDRTRDPAVSRAASMLVAALSALVVMETGWRPAWAAPNLQQQPVAGDVGPGSYCTLESALAAPLAAAQAGGYAGPLFDSHFHISNLLDPGQTGAPGPAERLCAFLQQEGTSWAIGFVSFPVGTRQAARIASVIIDAESRFLPLLAPSSCPPLLGTAALVEGCYTEDLLRDLLRPRGPFAGVGEIALYVPEAHSLTFDSPQMQAIFRAVDTAGGVVMIHARGTGRPYSPTTDEEVRAALSAYPNATFLFHGGGPGEPELIAPLLEEYPNVYFTWDVASWFHALMGGQNPMYPEGRTGGSAQQFEDDLNRIGLDVIVEQALALTVPLLEQHPDRVMWGTDRVFAWHIEERPTALIIEIGRRVIGRLPADLQEGYAFRNGARAFGSRFGRPPASARDGRPEPETGREE